MTFGHYIFKLFIALWKHKWNMLWNKPLAKWLDDSLLKLKGINELQIALAETGRSILEAILSFQF